MSATKMMRHRDRSKMDPVIADRCVKIGPERRVQQILKQQYSAYPFRLRKVGSSLPLFRSGRV
jgi:hypothetical protein